MKISKSTIDMLNEILVDFYHTLLSEGRDLVIMGKKSTLSAAEIETAVKLKLTGELQKAAVASGKDALSRYTGERD